MLLLLLLLLLPLCVLFFGVRFFIPRRRSTRTLSHARTCSFSRARKRKRAHAPSYGTKIILLVEFSETPQNFLDGALVDHEDLYYLSIYGCPNATTECDNRLDTALFPRNEISPDKIGMYIGTCVGSRRVGSGRLAVACACPCVRVFAWCVFAWRVCACPGMRCALRACAHVVCTVRCRCGGVTCVREWLHLSVVLRRSLVLCVSGWLVG